MRTTKKASLKDIKILLADSDSNLGGVLVGVLERMGFKRVQFVRDGASAIAALEQERKHILITEWQMQSMDGMQLTSFIRSSQEPAIRLLPIIMLTGRAEKQDVEAARDAGITEFVVKPYNSRTVFQRIQQVIENPRGFLVATQYVGPDRRRRDADKPVPEDRRKEEPEVVVDLQVAVKVQPKPKLIIPDHVLKKMLGDEALDAIITPQVLDKAQKAIDALKDESLTWIKQYLDELEQGCLQLEKSPSDALVEKIKESLLAIKSNAGTFGYVSASDVAQQLYQFMRFDFHSGDVRHQQVLMKHVQSLKLLLGSEAAGSKLEKQSQLLTGLKAMISKFQQRGQAG